MYIEIYKCKMCGKEIQKRSVNRIIADIDFLKEKNNERHFCVNGDLGIAEFIGYKRIVDSYINHQ